MDSHSEALLSLVFPPLAAGVRQMAGILAAELPAVTIRAVQGLRTWPEQWALWFKGRDANGKIVDPSQVVTHAKPGSSYHNYGLAVDVAPFDVNGLPDWNSQHPCWQRIVAVGELVGLYSGSHFKGAPTPQFPGGKPETDIPHFQLTGRFPHEPDDEVLYFFKEAGLQGLWAEVLK